MEDPATGNQALVAGSDPDVAAQIVVRITFTAAGETPTCGSTASTHPTSTPDATLLLGDFEWNEVCFQSVPQGGITGWNLTSS